MTFTEMQTLAVQNTYGQNGDETGYMYYTQERQEDVQYCRDFTMASPGSILPAAEYATESEQEQTNRSYDSGAGTNHAQ